MAIALIGPLAWETPYAMRAAQEMAKREEKKKTKDDAHRGWHRPACGSSLAHYLFWYIQFYCNMVTLVWVLPGPAFMLQQQS